jgi:replication fork protection complex subunit Tof1/Swi1
MSLARKNLTEELLSSLVDTLVGYYEGGANRMGDEVSGFLRDLKKDDSDNEHTVARIFWETWDLLYQYCWRLQARDS